jgi:hypothetical protein
MLLLEAILVARGPNIYQVQAFSGVAFLKDITDWEREIGN